MGNRISKTEIYPKAIKDVKEITTYYVRDAQGNVMAVYNEKKYEDGKIDLSLTEQHLYGSSRLGMRQVNDLLVEKDEIKEFDQAYSSRNLGEKSYELSNHLGNVLAVVSDKKKADGTADVKAVYDYYPFGMQMPGRFSFDPANAYRYGFNSHEMDSEVKGDGNHISWGGYGMDTRLGKRWNIDPLWCELPGQSPYSGNNNNPNLFFDPDGKWGISIHYDVSYDAARDVGFDRSFSKKAAYMASTYADMPPPAMALYFGLHLRYGRYGVHHKKGPTANSQDESESYRHVMMSDAEAAGGMTRQDAVNRGINMAWKSIFNAIETGSIEDLGVGLHGIQDVFAHEGMSTNEHLGINFSSAYVLLKDLGKVGFFDERKAKRATKGVLTVYGILTGNQKVIDEVKDRKGNIKIDLRGVTTSETQQKIREQIDEFDKNFEGNVEIQF
ncbi:MAG: hypothetical protein LBR52_05245 [Prevotellaceae bacterium]|jgi:hypothetical protein|nr:hypothetical protein [Prevotellaceae bacterium]